MRILCLIGLHKWITEERRRFCVFCGKKQEVLPGYGGQEPWCWVNKK